MTKLLRLRGFLLMKKTRKYKREAAKKINFFGEFLKIKKHFFKDLDKKIASVKDTRHQGYVIYPPEIILFTVIMKNVSGIVSMNKMTRDFNNDEAIANIGKTLGFELLEEIPHYDTINNFLKKLEVTELEKIRDYMIRELFKKRSLEKHRLLDKYWTIAIDGSQLYSFKERHCKHCLKKEYRNKETGDVEKTVYYHTVLEAKLVVGDMVFSLLTEFVENEDESVSKQDCEINAAKRLLKKLKFKFRKLNICLLGDSLYACGPLYKLCNEYNWKYIFRFKEGRASSIWREVQEINKIDNSNKEENINFINDINYQSEMLNITEFKEVKKKSEKGIEKQVTTEFIFVTNIRITKKNNFSIIQAGRSRWKIENEGFNNQKNVRYDIEHACCLDYQAIKNHYLLIQISDILRQLLENGSEALKELKAGIKEISSRILESFRRDPLTSEDISNIDTHIKIRYL